MSKAVQGGMVFPGGSRDIKCKARIVVLSSTGKDQPIRGGSGDMACPKRRGRGGLNMTPGIRKGWKTLAATRWESLDRGKVGAVNRFGCSTSEQDKGVSSLSSRKGEEKEDETQEKNEQGSWITMKRF